MTTTPSSTLSVGDRLARAREAAGLTQTELAQEIGIARVTLSYYENGRRDPSFNLVCAWAEATDVPLSYFANGTLTEGQTVANSCQGASRIRVPFADAWCSDEILQVDAGSQVVELFPGRGGVLEGLPPAA